MATMAEPAPLAIRPAGSARWDLVALGEVMLRLDPGEGRIATTRTFTAWEGGGEYNVARGLARCFGLRTAVVTAFADNAVGRLIEDLIRQGGVDQSLVRWVPYDGIGRTVRNGLNFTERGFGVRAALGVSDRGHTAASQLRPGDVDWDAVFGPGPAGRRVGRAGSTPAGSSPGCPTRPMRSPARRWRPRTATGPSSRTTSTTGPRCGRGSGARPGPGRSTGTWWASSTCSWATRRTSRPRWGSRSRARIRISRTSIRPASGA